MATMKQTVTDTPTALDSVTEGTTYAIQNATRTTDVLVSVASTAPSVTDAAFVLTAAYGFLYAKASTGESIYIWHNSLDDDGMVIYEESA